MDLADAINFTLTRGHVVQNAFRSPSLKLQEMETIFPTRSVVLIVKCSMKYSLSLIVFKQSWLRVM